MYCVGFVAPNMRKQDNDDLGTMEKQKNTVLVFYGSMQTFTFSD
jgi:hypothetical protein